jgi:predicted acetyltransferase
MIVKITTPEKLSKLYENDFDSFISYMNKTFSYFDESVDLVADTTWKSKTIFFYVKYKNSIVGILKFVIDIDDNYIAYVEVSKQFRQKGISKLLLQSAVEYCNKKNLRNIKITTFSEMGDNFIKPYFDTIKI